MKRHLALAPLILSLLACGEQSPTTGTDAPHAQSDNTMLAAVLSGLVGYSLGRSSSPAQAAAPQPTHTVINRTVIVNNHPPKADTPPAAPVKPVAAPTPPKPVVAPVAAPRPSYSGPSGYSSVRQSAPTYSSSFSRR